MNRRELFKTMAGVATAGAIGGSVRVWSAGDQRLRRKYGRLTVQSHTAHKAVTGETLHVFVNGADVTAAGCYEADDTEGYALVFCRDEQNHTDWTRQGHLHIGGDGRGACKMRLTGDVWIVPGVAL